MIRAGQEREFKICYGESDSSYTLTIHIKLSSFSYVVQRSNIKALPRRFYVSELS